MGYGFVQSALSVDNWNRYNRDDDSDVHLLCPMRCQTGTQSTAPSHHTARAHVLVLLQ